MRLIFGLIAFFSVLVIRADAHPFDEPSSLLDNFLEAEIVAVGRYRNAVPPDNALRNGQIELIFDEILVPHPILKGRKSILMPHREVGPQQFLVAMGIYKGHLDSCVRKPLDPQGEILRFVRGALKLKDRSELAGPYSVGFLHNPNEEVSRSAFTELGRLEYGDFRKLAEKIAPEPLAKALLDPKQKENHKYIALLLGHSGTKNHAVILRKLIDGQVLAGKRVTGYPLIGYVTLEPDAGFKYVQGLMEKADLFDNRVIAIQTIRWLGDNRTDLCDKKKCVSAIVRGLYQEGLKYDVVSTMRVWQRWEHCDDILDLRTKEGNQADSLDSEILCYALQCPTPRAKAFVTQQRVQNPESVAKAQKWLAWEKELAEQEK